MSYKEHEDFKKILEAPLLELFGWQGPALQNKAFAAYVQTLIGYFSRDISRLHSSAKSLRLGNTNKESKDIFLSLHLNRIRRSILKRQFNRARILLEALESESLIDSVWGAEFFFLFARLHELEEKNSEASNLYKKAGDLYEKNKCKKKSLRSFLNSLVCYGRNGKEDELIPDYAILYEQAHLYGDPVLAATCCHNISVTLSTMGAWLSSLHWANKAIEEVNDDTGSLNYFQCLLHRADTLLKMKRPLEARRDIDAVLISEHVTIQGAAENLLKSLDGKQGDSNDTILSPGWKKREMEKNDQALSEMEDKFIGLLIIGGKTRDEIIAVLWNEVTSDQEYLIDRFKQLLKRLRKKFKYPIRQKNSIYFIDFVVEADCKESCG